MIIVKSPLRISFFGGSTDYESFYRERGSFLIGTTIDKHVYLSLRYRAKMLSNESIITYSRSDIVKSWDEIKNPLIKEILKFKNLQRSIDFNSFSDIPSRTGLGGSSSFCVGLLYLLNCLMEVPQTKKNLIKDAIFIERHILGEAGGIQDQIWPVYGGLNTIEINTNGCFKVKPLGITEEFKEELQNSMLLIYSNHQREHETVAQSHENKNKSSILDISKKAHEYFIKEDIKSIGNLLYKSWLEKRNLSDLITTSKIDNIINQVMSMGAYGAKLLGSGGCGFILVMCNSIVKKNIEKIFENNIMPFKFESSGVSKIFTT
jgi:D-glycero-alpha-D-manno-heptose-7-phosphate kinase